MIPERFYPEKDRRYPEGTSADDDAAYPGTTPEDAMGTSALSYLLAGPILFGGIGWLVGRLTGLEWLVAVGILGGMALSIYVIWVRYGTQ